MPTRLETRAHATGEAGRPDPDLYEAVTRDDHLEVMRLVTSGSSPAATDPHFGIPVAYWAADLGHSRSLQILLSLGADRECVGFGGERPLHSAARRGDLACAAVLLISRADARAVNAALEQPLHVSASGGNLAVSYLLMACGADKSEADARGLTPAARAEEYGYTLLELLFTWFDARDARPPALEAFRPSLAFGQLRAWLNSFGLAGEPETDASRLHPLTRLAVAVERPQPTTAPRGILPPARASISEAGADLLM